MIDPLTFIVSVLIAFGIGYDSGPGPEIRAEFVEAARKQYCRDLQDDVAAKVGAL